MPPLSRARLPTGVELEYLDQGSGDALLLLHGYVDSWYSFHSVLEALPDTVRAIAPSQRGHGSSDKPPADYAMTDFADDAFALLDHLGIERALVCGHSMGTLIAQELALSHPHRVSRLVLICGATTGDNDVVREFFEHVRDVEDPVDREFARAFQAGTVATPLCDAEFDAIMAETMKVPARVWRGALAGIMAWRPPRPLREVACPTFIAWGDEDGIFPVSEQYALRDQIPDSTLRIYRTGHALHWEQPAEFAADLLAFAAGRPLPAR
ncbi:MAG: alpha/beta fold hydrolase [Candidatus Binatia bacterium]